MTSDKRQVKGFPHLCVTLLSSLQLVSVDHDSVKEVSRRFWQRKKDSVLPYWSDKRKEVSC